MGGESLFTAREAIRPAIRSVRISRQDHAGERNQLPGMDQFRACSVDARSAGIPGGICEREPSSVIYEREHQQSGILCSGGLPAAVAGEVAEALLSIRIFTHAAKRGGVY